MAVADDQLVPKFIEAVVSMTMAICAGRPVLPAMASARTMISLSASVKPPNAFALLADKVTMCVSSSRR